MSDVDELKKRFKQGAVPDESDYASLITLANPVTGNGLEVASGRLNVKAGDGISAGEGGVSVNVDRTTLDVTGGVLGVKLQAGGNSGLDSAGGLHVKTGAGLKADAAGLGVDLAENSGLAHDREVEGRWPLYVNVDEKTSGLEFDATTHKLQVKVPKNEKNYLVTGPEGLSLTADGITKMKAELEMVTSAALDNATKNTETGKSPDTTVAKETMEGRIATALNDAYKQGFNSINNLKPDVKNAQLRYPATGAVYTVDLAKDVGAKPKLKGNIRFAIDQQPDELWNNIVKEFTADGVLKLTGRASQEPLNLMVYATGNEPVVATQVRVTVYEPMFSLNKSPVVKRTEDGIDLVKALITVKSDKDLPKFSFSLPNPSSQKDRITEGRLYTNAVDPLAVNIFIQDEKQDPVQVGQTMLAFVPDEFMLGKPVQGSIISDIEYVTNSDGNHLTLILAPGRYEAKQTLDNYDYFECNVPCTSIRYQGITLGIEKVVFNPDWLDTKWSIEANGEKLENYRVLFNNFGGVDNIFHVSVGHQNQFLKEGTSIVLTVVSGDLTPSGTEHSSGVITLFDGKVVNLHFTVR